MIITEKWLVANSKKERRKALVKSDRDGLNVRVSPKGKITYTTRYYYNKQARRIDLGSYPLMSLKEAREENRRLRKKLEQGYDPKIIRQTEKLKIVTAKTFNDVFDDWYQKYCIQNKKNHKDIKRSFERYIFPKLGKLPVRDIRLQQWLAILEEVAQTRHAIAERLLTNSKQVLKWAMKREWISANCLSDIGAKEDLQIRKKVTTRILSDEEIKMVFMAMYGSNMTDKNKYFIELCLQFACRNAELRLAKKADFDFDKKIWTVPVSNHKMGKITGKSLVRPIVDGAEQIIKQVGAFSPVTTEHLFTNAGTDKPMGSGSPLPLPYNIMKWLRKNRGYDMPHWSIHDLRRTARTNFSRLTSPHIAEIMLGHSLGKIWNTYDHHDYLEQQREAYSKWSQKLACLKDEALHSLNIPLTEYSVRGILKYDLDD